MKLGGKVPSDSNERARERGRESILCPCMGLRKGVSDPRYGATLWNDTSKTRQGSECWPVLSRVESCVVCTMRMCVCACVRGGRADVHVCALLSPWHARRWLSWCLRRAGASSSGLQRPSCLRHLYSLHPRLCCFTVPVESARTCRFVIVRLLLDYIYRETDIYIRIYCLRPSSPLLPTLSTCSLAPPSPASPRLASYLRYRLTLRHASVITTSALTGTLSTRTHTQPPSPPCIARPASPASRRAVLRATTQCRSLSRTYRAQAVSRPPGSPTSSCPMVSSIRL